MNEAMTCPFDDLWALSGPIVRKVELTLAEAKAALPAPSRIPAGAQRLGSVAVVDVAGVLTKDWTVLSLLFGGTPTSLLAERIRQLTADPKVMQIVLRIDSPGGTVSGTAALGEAVRRAALEKSVVAYIDDLGTSAAYWIASQARTVYVGPTALVGSIGVYTSVADISELMNRAGIRVHLVNSGGELKGAGTPGTKITDAQLAALEQRVKGVNRQFILAVSRGRGKRIGGLAGVAALADGRTFTGQEALAAGLADGVRLFDAESVARLAPSLTGDVRAAEAMAAREAERERRRYGRVRPGQY